MLRGHDVHVTTSVADATPVIDAPFDVVVVDRYLGDGDGLELLDRSTCPVKVLMSGAPPTPPLSDRVRRGELQWLDKPFQVARVRELLAIATQRSAA